MARETAFFVQFPHPGGEHRPRADHMQWNTGDHARKFLISPGRYTAGGSEIREADLVFWGEWEAPSTIERRWPASGRLPRALHRPWWIEPGPDGPRQNTDPWVFGKRMLYSNCKQTSGPQGRPTSMQRLARGSVICFGSAIDGEFCVDTVFVVASAEPWAPADVQDMRVDEAFRTCTAESVALGTRSARNPHVGLTLYRGATTDDPVEGMFSFVPAGLADVEDPRFPRAAVESKFVNPSSRQSTWGSKRPLALDELREAWDSIRRQVLGSDLLLAVAVQTPGRRSKDEASPPGPGSAGDRALGRTRRLSSSLVVSSQRRKEC